MSHAVANLKVAMAIARNNLPINWREGNRDQALLEAQVLGDCRLAVTALDRVKLASFLADKPGAKDYFRIGGRTALEGGIGGYGSAALTSVLLGLISKRFPGSISPAMFGGLAGGAGVAGALTGGRHGYNAAMSNARERLGPIGKLKRLVGV